tara:strand:- start:1129 stop:2268 length:1140 start_codon:yes stop_codon:yes gene_type:complete
MYKCFLTCPRGLEEQAKADIFPIINNSKIDRGGIKFDADLKSIYSVNVHSRLGMHLLVKLFEFNATSNEELYSYAYDFDWNSIINTNQTFLIRLKGKSNYFKNNNYTVLKIKDAIVDKIKKSKLIRPSIDKQNPDIIFSIHINENKITVYIDSTGTSMHKRGYRNKIHRAMLNESLAAGLIMLSGWDKESPFYDPMCGSGTLPIEAALMSYNIVPGLLRTDYSFKNWNNYDKSIYDKVVKKAKSRIFLNKDVKIFGYDLAFNNVAIALSSVRTINLQSKIKIQKLDFKNFKPLDTEGTIVINPPYGERLQFEIEKLNEFYQMIGDIFKKNCHGHNCFVFSSNLEAIKFIGLQSKFKLPLKNGKLDCRFISYPIKSGTYE